MLRKLSPPTKHAAAFDPYFQEGRVLQDDKELLFLLNWGEGVESLTVDVKGASKAFDFWTDVEVGIYGGHLILELQAHGARVLVLEHGKR